MNSSNLYFENFERAVLQTSFGQLVMYAWPPKEGKEPIAISTTKLDYTRPILVRIHSECITSEVFGSLHCDCLQQKNIALKQIAESDNGIFIYERQEGRGIGLQAKLRAYNLQAGGLDTHEANLKLGFPADARSYECAIQILKFFGAKDICLLTNNPEKVNDLMRTTLLTVTQIPLIISPNGINNRYLEAKRSKFGHWL